MKRHLTNIPWQLHLSQYLLVFHMLNIEKWEHILNEDGVISKCNVRRHHYRTLSENHRRSMGWLVVFEV